jgi:hypothetical protein
LETNYSAWKKPREKIDHHAVAAAHSKKQEPEDPGHHIRMDHRVVGTSHSKRERIRNPGHRDEQPILRWELTALHTGFAECRYPKDSNYLMTTKSMMDHLNPSRGYQTTCCKL